MDIIDPGELAKHMKQSRMHRRIIVLDVRNRTQYKQGHIPGAVNVSMEKLANALPSLAGKNDLIVTHCGGGTRGPRAYTLLKTLGYENIRCMREGFRGWKKTVGKQL